ncbi:hypothetical protein GOV13_00870 [Candidatus Pacearchaeota archaeon]|nr:hypothetical protein [Candidatus Pacearchaeota archaeon]
MREDINKKRRMILILFISIFLLLSISTISAGWLKDIKNKITGEATQTVGINITVGGPQITAVFNDSITDVSSGPNEAPSQTDVIINFTAYTAAGATNLNDSTALINFTRTGETTRQDTSCSRYASSGDYANYTCNVTMWWFDGAGVWNITAYIADNQSNSATNASQTFSVGSRTAFVMSPSALTWAGLSPGSTNQTSNNDPLLLNNTGNDVIDAGSIEINASNLRGETTSTEALWAGNFSVSSTTGGICSGAACTECGGNAMNRSNDVGISVANLTKGNYTLADGTAQEGLYFCLTLVGSELSTQAYSTANETEWSWIIQTS